MELDGVSAMAARSGKNLPVGPPVAVASTATVDTTSPPVPIVSIANSLVEGVNFTRINRRGLDIERLIISNETGGKQVDIRVWEHNQDGGAPDDLTGYQFEEVSAGSYVLKDESSSAFDATNADLIASFAVTAGDTIVLPIEEALERGEVLTITGVVGSSTTNVTVTIVARERP
jgi:hypothetical protein